MGSDDRILDTLEAMFQLQGKTPSRAAIELMLADLRPYPVEAVLRSLARCRIELRYFPTVADIVERIDDGRPGAEEAWAMLPKSEAESCVWTEEMREAFGVARPLLGENLIQARAAFVEVYRKIMGEARAERRPPKWSVTLGHSTEGRKVVLKEAIAKGRITLEQAGKVMPELTGPRPVAQLEGPDEPEANPAKVRLILRKALIGHEVEP